MFLQTGYIICLSDATNVVIIGYSFSIKCKSVMKNILETKMSDIAHGLHIIAVIILTLEKI